MSKTVAILGNGVVGMAIGRGFSELGHEVVFGTRSPAGEKSRQALAAVPGSRAASSADAVAAVAAGGFVVVALPWSGLREGVEQAGAGRLSGKILIDAVNPLDFSTGTPTLAVGFDDSAGETLQRLAPAAKVVKAFNIITASHMYKPDFGDGVPDMFIAGNDAGAKSAVSGLLGQFGWRRPIDMGDIGASRLLEPLAMVWISYGFRNDHWTHGFSLLGRKD